MKKSVVFTAVTLTAIGVASAAFAVDKDDVKNLAAAKISLTEAIAIAEKQHAGSKAIDASLDDTLNKTVYDVTVLVGEVGYEVDIDAVTGEVLSNKKD